ncbi:hypothetical protein LCGC14_1898740 [marine sediment metagenome]|uniref:Uncharacterized protein n=1 Tax=marine sediment metagenome TaxID=412755 RepID=A0A0F9GKL6_9ZZZZ
MIRFALLIGLAIPLLIACEETTGEGGATAEPVATEAVEAQETEAPEATATASLPALTTEECAYVTTVQSQLSTFGDATIEASELMTEPQFLSEDWILALGLQLAILQVTADEAASLNPPESLQSLHGTYVPVAENLAQAASLIASGI